MTINRALVFLILMSAIAAGGSGPAMAQACTHEGANVSCDDGRRGLLSGDAIIWPMARDRACRRTRASSSEINHQSSWGRACSSAKETVLCRWTIQARRTRRAVPFSMGYRIVTRA